jgi:hypothetical protein
MLENCSGWTVQQLAYWSDWQPLYECWRGNRIPSLPGLYRIRRAGQQELAYIGQTGSGGMTLKKRMAMLRGIYAVEMPYRDPHTAAPALWSIRHAEGCDFEVSVLPGQWSTPWRKGLEALSISLYRHVYQKSPEVNFGRMPAGYQMSTANNAHLKSSGKRYKGGSTQTLDKSHVLGIQPIGSLISVPNAKNWAGHQWTDWASAEKALGIPKASQGLYRIRSQGNENLIYIGQGILQCRLKAHLSKIVRAKRAQDLIFLKARPLEFSWVINPIWKEHHRLELENDLIASHLLMTEQLPSAQFMG